MKILLTGGSGDLGKILANKIEKQGDQALRLDLHQPDVEYVQFIQGSILDRKKLSETKVLGEELAD